MTSQSLSVRSTALVRMRYTALAQRVLHDAEEMALDDQRQDPTADEVIVAILLTADRDPLLSEFLARHAIDRNRLADVVAARHAAATASTAESADAYRAWIRITAITAPVDLRVMLSSLIISTWLSAITRVVLEQAGITHDHLMDDLERYPAGDSEVMAALLGADPDGPPLGRLVSPDERLMIIGRTASFAAASTTFARGEAGLLLGRRGVGKAVIARAAAAASGRLAVEVPMAIVAHLSVPEVSAKFAELTGYLLARRGGLLVTDADKRIDLYLADLPPDLPLLVTLAPGARLPRLGSVRAVKRITVREASPDVAWRVINEWSAREGVAARRVDPSALTAAVSLAHRFLSAGDTALPGSAIDLIRHARPVREDGILDAAAIEAAITMTTGLPAAIISDTERARLNDLGSHLSGRIVGQLEAIGATVKVVRRRAVRLGQEKSRPLGIFIFLGPTGVGKTELARAVADIVYGSADSLVKFNMGEFQEKHELAKLLGSPPGYVGSDEEGELTLAVRARPDGGVLLLDEYEKAHANVSNLMLGVFDDGIFKGNKGQPVDLSNWIIIMTSNLGSDTHGSIGFSSGVAAARTSLTAARVKAVKEHWRPEFLNRIHAVVHFDALSVDELEAVLDLRLAVFRADLASVRLAFRMGPRMRHFLASEAFASGYGGRDMILRRFPEEIEDRFADLLLGGDYRPGDCYVLEIDDAGSPQMTRLGPGDEGHESPWASVAEPARRKRQAARETPSPQPGVMRA